MDIAQVVEEALVSGAAVAAKAQVSAVVSDALTSLSGMLRRVFSLDPVGRMAVEKLQDAPCGEEAEVWRAQLHARLQAVAGADLRDLEIAARELLALIDPDGAVAGRYVLTAGQVGTSVGQNVDIRAETRGVAGWTVGNVSIGGGLPDPPVPGRSSRR